MGENHFAQWPVVIYGIDLLACGAAYYILQLQIVRKEGPDSTLAKALGRDWKGKSAFAVYAGAILLVFVNPLIYCAIYLDCALLWCVPDARIERLMK